MSYWGNWFPSQAATTPYHGIRNQGATCYLNSVLQVLFMTKDFKEAVKRCSDEKPVNCIDQHLKSLFEDLERHQAYTYNITRTLGINSVYEQQDAAEYFEKILGLTSPDASKIFQGQLTHKTECSTCFTPTHEDVAFWHLPLDLVDSCPEDYSVVNGIDEFFKTSVVNGQNQMYCEDCDAKSDTTIKCEVKRHPKVLMLLLKRFKFDYRNMKYVKINCWVSVPHTLQIPESQIYELYAVVDHFGDLRSGHYSATIMAQDDQSWYNFNDTMVTMLEDQPFQVDNHARSNTAYLLFYRKKEVPAADTCAPETEQMGHPGGFPTATSNIYDQGRDGAEMRGRAEFKRAGEAGNDTAVAVSGYTKTATGIKNIVNDEFRGVGLSRDLYSGEKQQFARQSMSNKHQEGEEEGKGLHSQRDEVKIMIEDEEDLRGNTSRVAHLEQSVDHQDSEGQQDVTERRPEERPEHHETRHHGQQHQQDVSNMHVRPDYPCVDMRKGEEMGVYRDKDGQMKSGEESERRASTKRPGRETKHHVRQNMYEDQKAGRDFDVDKQGEDERMEVVEQVDRGRKPKAGEYLSERGKTTEGDQRYNQATSRFYQADEQQRVEKRGVKGDRKHRREDDQPAHRRGTSERQKQDQNQRSENFSRTPQAREEKTEQRREDSFLIRAGSSREGQNRGDAGPKTERCVLEQSKIYHGQIIEEEWQGGDRTSVKTEKFRIKTGKLGGSVQSLVEYGERRSDPSADAKGALSEGVNNMKLDESEQPRRQKHRAEGTPGAEVQAGKKIAKKIKFKSKRKLRQSSSPLRQKEKRRKTLGCFSAIFRKSKKKAEQASDTD